MRKERKAEKEKREREKRRKRKIVRHVQTYSDRDRFWHAVQSAVGCRLSALVVVVVVVFVAAAATARVYVPQRMHVQLSLIEPM